MSKELKELREKIDDIDKRIVKLLNERAKLSKKVGDVKREKSIEIIDFSREKEVYRKVISYSEREIPDENLISIYREIIASSRKLQKCYTVSVLGPEGTFSHIVFRKFFGNNTNCKFTENIKEIFKDIAVKNSKFGIIPVENSVEGSISQSLDYLSEFDVKVWAELHLKISFNFVSFQKDISKIRKIYSHPHAIAQCRNFIEKNFSDAEIIELSSTSSGIKFVKEDLSSGAIVSPFAGEIYKIPVIFENIEDNPNNFTRFFVISDVENKLKKGEKTSIIFAVSHKPKSLLKALEVIAKFNLNMCKLQSRPLKGIPWEYMFFVDIEGEISDEFLKELQDKTTYLKYLGTYPVEKILL